MTYESDLLGSFRRFKHDPQKLVSHLKEWIKNRLEKKLNSFKHFDLHGEKLSWASQRGPEQLKT